MKKLGLIINPIAGMGGSVGLKGTDGEEILSEALIRGAKPASELKAEAALKSLLALRDKVYIVTCSGSMGESLARKHGFEVEVVHQSSVENTSADDTRLAAGKMIAADVDLLLFAGGDGTARNIQETVGERIISLGIPTGVKIHSAVFAQSATKAGLVAASFLEGKTAGFREGEVMDIDEEAYRQGQVSARLYGYLKVPQDQQRLQNLKARSNPAEKSKQIAIAEYVIDEMEEDCFYIIGPGSTTVPIMEQLGLPHTLLGIDIVKNRQLISSDPGAKEIRSIIQGKNAKIILTPIGGQGFLLGRGNQQLTPEILQLVGRENIIAVATQQKLLSLAGNPMLVDTGDDSLNQTLSGYLKVITGYREMMMHKITS